MATTIVVGPCRGSFLHVFTPRAVQEGQEAKYSGCVLINKKDTATVSAVKAAIAAETSIGWPNGKLPKGFKSPLKDGDGLTNSKTGEQRPETKGCFVINASSKTKPGIVDAQRQEVIDPAQIYSGANYRWQLAFAPYKLPTSSGIGCYLNNLQKTSDGPSLEGRMDAKDAFDDYTPPDGTDC